MTRLLCVVLALGLVACDSDDGGTDAGGGGGTDAGPAGADAGGGGVPVDVVFALVDGDAPVAGATAAMDRPDGTREELVSDASGQVTFSVDWAAGAHAFAFHADGYTIAAATDVTAESVAPYLADGPFEIPMGRNAPRDDLVTLSGTITGGSSPSSGFAVYPAAPGSEPYQAMGPDFEIMVPPGEAFRATVFEFTNASMGPNEYTQTFLGFRYIDIDALSADSMQDIDLTDGAETLTEVDVTVTAPGMGTPLADGRVYATVTERGTGEVHGAASAAAPSGADVSLTIAFATPAFATDPITTYNLSDEPLGSTVTVDGVPTAGTAPVEFLTPPDIVTPSFGTAHGLYDPIVLGRIAPGVRTQLIVQDASREDITLMNVASLTGSETLTIPEPPSSASAADLFPAGADLYARPVSCEVDFDNRRCRRVSFGRRQFDLSP